MERGIALLENQHHGSSGRWLWFTLTVDWPPGFWRDWSSKGHGARIVGNYHRRHHRRFARRLLLAAARPEARRANLANFHHARSSVRLSLLFLLKFVERQVTRSL